MKNLLRAEKSTVLHSCNGCSTRYHFPKYRVDKWEHICIKCKDNMWHEATYQWIEYGICGGIINTDSGKMEFMFEDKWQRCVISGRRNMMRDYDWALIKNAYPNAATAWYEKSE